MFNRTTVLAAFILVLAAALWAPPTHADGALRKVNRVTFSRAVALPGVVLLAGSYVFEAGPAGSHPDVVRVTSTDYRRVYFTGFTRSVLRPAGMAASEVMSIGEAAIGAPAPIRAWYPIGSKLGHEFRYW